MDNYCKSDVVWNNYIDNDKIYGLKTKIILNTIDNILKIHMHDIIYYKPKYNLYNINIKR